MNIEFRPFRSIPRFPEEPRLPLPTRDSSVFNDPSNFIDNIPKLYKYPVILRVIQNFKPGILRNHLLDDVNRIRYDFKMFRILKELIENKVLTETKRFRPEGLEEIDRLDALNEALFAPPEYCRIRMLFEKHYIVSLEEFEKIKSRALDEAKKIFHKGEDNIILLENSDTLNNFDKNYLEGYKKYKSAFKAYIYASLISRNIKPSTINVEMEFDKQKELISDVLNNPVENDPRREIIYHYVECEVIDQLISEGYKIDIVFEKNRKIREIIENQGNN
jgi:hypothetical protein